MSRNRIVGLLFILCSFFGGWVWMEWRSFHQAPINTDGGERLFTVNTGESMSAVANRLAEQGVIENAATLSWVARYKGLASQIQAGEYTLEPGITASRLLDQLVRGEVTRYSLTLVEGWNFLQVLAAISRTPELEHTLKGLTAAEIMDRIGYPGIHPEGRFFPDSYHFSRGMSDADILRRAYRTMEQVLQAEWEQRAENLPYETAEEALIMASIIEKETGLPEERQTVAGVFVRRLQRGMLLQTDPTIIYGLGEDFDGDLRRNHLKDRSNRYNTYRHKGLPPTPIAMPGRDSIHAALHPAPGKALYFVARGDGSHHFSATLKEHNRAVRKYQLQKSASPPEGAGVAR